MKLIVGLALLMLLVSPVVGIVALVMRVDVETLNTSTLLVAIALAFVALCAGVNLALRGWAKVKEAEALNTAADARRIHGMPAPAPTYNTTIGTVNMLSMRNPQTGEVRQLPAGDAILAGSLMRQYAMQGWELELEARNVGG